MEQNKTKQSKDHLRSQSKRVSRTQVYKVISCLNSFSLQLNSLPAATEVLRNTEIVSNQITFMLCFDKGPITAAD